VEVEEIHDSESDYLGTPPRDANHILEGPDDDELEISADKANTRNEKEGNTPAKKNETAEEELGQFSEKN